jgi:hypothetical protein
MLPTPNNIPHTPYYARLVPTALPGITGDIIEERVRTSLRVALMMHDIFQINLSKLADLENAIPPEDGKEDGGRAETSIEELKQHIFQELEYYFKKLGGVHFARAQVNLVIKDSERNLLINAQENYGRQVVPKFMEIFEREILLGSSQRHYLDLKTKNLRQWPYPKFKTFQSSSGYKLIPSKGSFIRIAMGAQVINMKCAPGDDVMQSALVTEMKPRNRALNACMDELDAVIESIGSDVESSLGFLSFWRSHLTPEQVTLGFEAGKGGDLLKSLQTVVTNMKNLRNEFLGLNPEKKKKKKKGKKKPTLTAAQPAAAPTQVQPAAAPTQVQPAAAPTQVQPAAAPASGQDLPSGPQVPDDARPLPLVFFSLNTPIEQVLSAIQQQTARYCAVLNSRDFESEVTFHSRCRRFGKADLAAQRLFTDNGVPRYQYSDPDSRLLMDRENHNFRDCRGVGRLMTLCPREYLHKELQRGTGGEKYEKLIAAAQKDATDGRATASGLWETVSRVQTHSKEAFHITYKTAPKLTMDMVNRRYEPPTQEEVEAQAVRVQDGESPEAEPDEDEQGMFSPGELGSLKMTVRADSNLFPDISFSLQHLPFKRYLKAQGYRGH